MKVIARKLVLVGAVVSFLCGWVDAGQAQDLKPEPNPAAQKAEVKAPPVKDPNAPAQIPMTEASAPDPNAPVQVSAADDPMARAIEQYRAIVQAGGWPVVPDGNPLKKGDRDERVAIVRTRLVKSGDLDASLDNGDQSFDPAVHDAVVHFQARHGEEGDGIVGGETLAAMNIPAEQRLEQLELNVQRRIDLPSLAPGKAVIVNIPDFTLTAAKDRKAVLLMKVVVGKEFGQTPTFSDEIETIVFNPTWNVPMDITKEEIIAKVQKDPSYLSKKHLEVVQGEGKKEKILNPASIHWSSLGDKVPFRLRQKPGPTNPLGRVKFLLPNKDEIYLHDTPEQATFDENERSESHGCIRVEKPVELAEFLLEGDANWNHDAIVAAMKNGEEKHVKLPQKVPIHILYRTAWVRDGQVNFREDFYKKDGVEPEKADDAALSTAPGATDSTTQTGAKRSGGSHR